MRFLILIAFVASTSFCVSTASQGQFSSEPNVTDQSSKPVSVYSHLQVTRRQLQKKHLRTSSKTKKDHIHATPTSNHIRKDTKSPQRSSTHSRRTLRPILFTKIYNELTNCLQGIQPHTQRIMDTCRSRIDRSNSAQVAWVLLAELRAILDLLRDCHRRIRDCDGATSPSGTPGGGGRGAPCPTLADICRVLSQIVRELKTCFSLLTSLSSRLPVFRQICGETLNNMSEALSIIVNVSGVHLGDVSGGLGQIFRPAPNFFNNLGFGFASLSNILGL